MNDHITDKAGFLAALAPDDPERRLGEEHARGCAPCREALAEGARLIDLLQEALPLPALSPEALARTAAMIENGTDDEKHALRRLSWAAAGALVVSWVFQLMVGSGFVLTVRQATVSLSVLAVAIVSVTLLAGRERLAVGIMLGTSALLAYFAGTGTGLEAGIGIRCAFRELWAAAIPWVMVTTLARREGVSLSRWSVIATASAGALAAHAGQHLACRVPHADAHLFVFHFSAVIVACLLGALTTLRRPALVRP